MKIVVGLGNIKIYLITNCGKNREEIVMHKRIQYDIDKYRFAELVSKAFEVDDLSLLHINRKDLLPPQKLDFSNESKTKFHELFYKKLNSPWTSLIESYEDFIKNEISLYFKEGFIYQTFPTFRVHIPNYKAIHQWHYDSDPIHKHPPWEINVQVPLTKIINTQATWIESVPGLEDFLPMEMDYGEYVFFDGNRCKHGNRVNKEGHTRVSFDFRVMPLSKYTGQSKSSVTSQKRFIVGEYYKIFNKLDEG